MRRCFVVLLCLAFPAAAVAENKDRPLLVLDAGGHTARVWKVLFTPDGKEVVTVSDDKTVRVWDAATGEPLRVLRPPVGPGHEGRLYAAALSPDGRTLAVGGYGSPADLWGTIYLIALATGRIERTLKGHTNVIYALAFSPDGRRLASGSYDRTARVWDAGEGKRLRVLTGHTHHIYGVAWSPDGRRLATASLDRTGRLWSAASGRCQAVLRGHDEEVNCVAWSPDGKAVATGSFDRSVRLWDAGGTPGQRFGGLANKVLSVAFTADSRGLLFTWGGVSDVRGAALLDLAGGKERVRFDRHTNTVLHGAFSPDGGLAATADSLGEVYLWKTADGSVVVHLAGKGEAVWAAGWAEAGKAITWGNTDRGSSLRADKPLERTFRLADLEFGPAPDPDARRARPQRGALSLEAAGPTEVIVRRDKEEVARLKMSYEYDQVRCFTLLPGGRAAVGAEFGLYLFDTDTGKRLREFRGHTGTIWAVAPSPDDRYLLSASGDQTLRVWDPGRDQSLLSLLFARAEPLLSLFFAGDDRVAWTPEGYYAASPGGERFMGWHVGNGPGRMADFHPAARFRKSLYRPDVIKRLLEAGSVEKALALADRARGKKSERTEVSKVLPPRVAITSPAKSGLRVPKAEVRVRAVAASVGGHPVTALRLLLDGRPYQGQAGTRHVDEPELGEVSASWDVTLDPGRHRLAVQADSAVGQGLSDEVVVVYVGEEDRPQVRLPNLYVLAVGVANYRDDKLRLRYAARDARAVADTFQARSKPLFRAIDAKLLVDGEATRSGILKGLGWLRREMTQRDYAVVFFSGHGARDADGALYLLPADADPDDLLSTAVPAGQLKTILVGLPGKVVFLLDACHAGAVESTRRKAASALTDDLVRDLVTDESGLVVMCSSTGRESSEESSEHRQGNFTLAVVEGLSGKAGRGADGAVYLHHLDGYVTDRVKQLTGGRQHPVTAKPASIRSFPLAKP